MNTIKKAKIVEFRIKMSLEIAQLDEEVTKTKQLEQITNDFARQRQIDIERENDLSFALKRILFEIEKHIRETEKIAKEQNFKGTKRKLYITQGY